MLCVGGNSHRGDGVTPSVTLSMHVNPSTPPNPPSGPPSYGPLRPTCWPGSGRSTTFRPGSAAASGGGGSTAVASVQLRPSTVWLSLPLLQRLQAFFAPLTSLPEKVAQQSRYDSAQTHSRCRARDTKAWRSWHGMCSHVANDVAPSRQ